jgi:hypothetical protein
MARRVALTAGLLLLATAVSGEVRRRQMSRSARHSAHHTRTYSMPGRRGGRSAARPRVAPAALIRIRDVVVGRIAWLVFTETYAAQTNHKSATLPGSCGSASPGKSAE